MIWFSNIVSTESEDTRLILYNSKELKSLENNKYYILGVITNIFDKKLYKKSQKLYNIFNIKILDETHNYSQLYLTSYKIDYNNLDHLQLIYNNIANDELTTEDKIILLIIFDKTIKHRKNLFKINKI